MRLFPGESHGVQSEGFSQPSPTAADEGRGNHIGGQEGGLLGEVLITLRQLLLIKR